MESPNRKLWDSDIEAIREMYASGIHPDDIAPLYGVKSPTIYRYTRDLREVFEEARKKDKPFNYYHEGCRKCKYATKLFGAGLTIACDYLEITGKRRGCPGVGCTKFEKRTKPLRKPKRSIVINFENTKRYENDRYDYYGDWDSRKAQKEKDDSKGSGE